MAFGFYSQTFMNLWVDTPFPLNDVKNAGDVYTESLYLHELVHFIQDVTTTYGLMNINVTADYMRFANRAVVHGPAGPFFVPVLSKPGDPFNVDANKTLNTLYFGSGKDPSARILNVLQQVVTVSSGSSNKPLPIVQVKYMRPSDRSTAIFYFGALCILESMAYLIQKQCYPTSHNLDDLP
jgi:hypothetical protein